MQQYFSDFWNAIDWPNSFASGIVGIILVYATAKIYPMWVISRETSRIILRNRKKSAISRDLRIVLQMKRDPGFLVLWCTVILFRIVMICALVAAMAGLFSAQIYLGVETTGPVVRYLPVGGFAVLFTIMFLERLNLRRVMEYHTNFDEFLRRVREVLTAEELDAIEADENKKPQTK